MVEIKQGRHTLKDWLELLWITIRPPRRRLLPTQQRDKAFVRTLTLDTLERIHHAIWFDRTRERYVKAELRRRAVKAIYGLGLERNRFLQLGHLVDRRKDRPKV